MLLLSLVSLQWFADIIIAGISLMIGIETYQPRSVSRLWLLFSIKSMKMLQSMREVELFTIQSYVNENPSFPQWKLGSNHSLTILD
ncbi:hypothetical protein Scep_022066 [Stephania cephalantha]|uniref:Uncharacterized protein n=1 Tax=Stephania cephalantha TaxID=152367 RepID=A0AAP0I0P6_9MAGN